MRHRLPQRHRRGAVTPLRAAILATLACAPGAHAEDGPAQLETVIVNGGRPTSLPTQIPTTIEGISGAQVERSINAADSEDALKYLPSLNVRKRYTGDYDHAVLASRASGTGNSARSLVYADGILLSNLLGNGATYTPRWGLVTPEEIERVDVLYGPFSAAYPGNSVGAVVDFQTRMPTRLEAHVKLSGAAQGFQLYRTDKRYDGWQGSASVGDRKGAWSYWVDVSRLSSDAQPIGFANKLVSSGTPGTAGVPVTGAVAGRNPSNADWLLLGATNQTHTVQDHAKFKLAWDISPTLRASYTAGWWRNDAVRVTESYLRDAAGNPVVTGKGQYAHFTAAQIGEPEAKRTYAALDMYLEHPMRNGWFGRINYTLSRSKGNMEGQTRSDTGQTDVATSAAWDFPEFAVGSDGLLPNDRKHQLKAFGVYQLTPEWSVGGYALIQSGRPRLCLGTNNEVDENGSPSNPLAAIYGGPGYGPEYYYCNGDAPRGSQGRLPWEKRLDLNLSYSPNFAKGLVAKIDVFNVFNSQRPLTQQSQYDDGDQNVIYAYYNETTAYQTPRSVKLTVEYNHRF